ncbi:MAG TPA: PEFG-CTERM sorting domain-containing protein [Candidatus Nitrosotenuis sp.]
MADSFEYDMTLPNQYGKGSWPLHIKLSIMNDATNLYFQSTITGPSNVDWHASWAEYRFDKEHDSKYDQNEDMLVMWSSTGFEDLVSNNTDVKNGGKNDGMGAMLNGTTYETIEVMHPLCSGDKLDFCLKVGDRIGFAFGYGVLGTQEFWPSADVTNFADIVIAGDNSKWNVGEVRWVEKFYSAIGTGVVRVNDPNKDLDPEISDNFQIDVWSDSDVEGITLTLEETDASTGMFEGTVFFTKTDDSSGNKLRVSEGDKITARYVDTTLPNPFTTADKLHIEDIAIIKGKNVWSLGEIEGKNLDLVNNDGIIVFPPNIENYFPVNKIIREKNSKDLIPPGRFSEYEIAKYDGENLTLRKTTRIIIITHDEFVSIFGEDRVIEPLQINTRTVTIDDNYILAKINSALSTCSQQNPQKVFCNSSTVELKNLISEKIGTHTINETLVLRKIITYPKDGEITNSTPFASIIPIKYNDNSHGKNEQINVIFPTTDFGVGKIGGQYDPIPFADATTGQFQQSADTYNLTFLNGFTIGYGFEREWSYEYDVLSMIPISADLHIENGLGIGLRIPIQVIMKINPIIQNQQTTNEPEYEVKYTINTLDLDERRYQEIGLPSGQEFAGKEFKIYLGPRLDFVIKIFGDEFFEQDESLVPVDVPTATDFAPPLGTKTTITDYQLPCDWTRTCFDSPLVSGGLYTGAKVDLAGEKITIDSTLLNPIDRNSEKFTFMSIGEQRTQDSMIEVSDNTIISSEDQQYIPYGVELQNVEYRSDLDVIPRIMLQTKINPWIFPLNLSTDWIDLPGIQFSEVVFETHANTDGIFKTTDGKYVVPEFGMITVIILAFALVSITLINKVQSLRMN